MRNGEIGEGWGWFLGRERVVDWFEGRCDYEYYVIFF